MPIEETDQAEPAAEVACGLCEGTGERLRTVPGGCVSQLVPCFACLGEGLVLDVRRDRRPKMAYKA